MPGRHNCTDSPSCFPKASERWEAELGFSNLRGEDSAQIEPVRIAYGATSQQLIPQFFV
jgi:hypothetical protein